MKKKNKYKGKKYKKPLDNYLSEYTSLDNGGTIKRANESIRKYANGTTINPIGSVINNANNQQIKALQLALGLQGFDMGNFDSGEDVTQTGEKGFDKFLSNLQGSDLGNALGQFGASATLGLSSAAVQNLINTAMGGGDNFEGMRPQFTGATKQFEDGGVIPMPGLPDFSKKTNDNKVPLAPTSQKISQAITSGVGAGASVLSKANVESLSNTPEEERIYKHRSDGFSTSKQKIKNVEKYSTLLNKYAQRDGINLNELQSIMAIESGGVPTATSGAAFGLMQITKDTWEGITKRREEENKERIEKGLEPLPTYKFNKANWSDPEKNIDYGSETFARKYKSLDAYGVPSNHPLRGALATTAYNVGPGTLKDAIEAAKAAGSDDPFADALNPKYLSKGVEETKIYKYYLTGRGKKRNKHFDEEGNLKEGSTMADAKAEAIALKTKEGSTYAPKFSTYNKNFFQPYYGNEENIAALKNGG
jgi:hypothetical protein